MEKSRVEELEEKIATVNLEIAELEKKNRLIEIDILKKKLAIEKIKLEQMNE